MPKLSKKFAADIAISYKKCYNIRRKYIRGAKKMKKILASAAIFAVLLCGCSDIEEINVPSVNPASSEQEASLPESGFSEYSYS
ncbi:MAG TPA: hypothetical protein DER68_04250, partial [Ruminococcaceae bacterium]|nr:hypothetical protein [Oscillospiraceae bacterium]